MTEERIVDQPSSSVAPQRQTDNDTSVPQHLDGTGKPESTTKCECSQTGRNLVVCLDGTANQFGNNNTNVIELYSLIKKPPDDDRQLTFYNSGIGTYARPSWKSWSYWKQVIDHKIDLAIAWNFEEIMLEAYHWLSENYMPGDRIYLFGFSRGAYQVRALSAMIEKVGLLHKGNAGQIPFAYELYADPQTGDAQYNRRPKAKKHTTSMQPDSQQDPLLNTTSSPLHPGSSASAKRGTKAENFKKTFSRNVPVHFVGVWDTVSSVGLVRNATLPFTTDGMGHVCFFRHALALDERRVKFLPEYAHGGRTLLEDDVKTAAASRFPHTKEVWFPGTHSDIGGGNVDNPYMDRTRPPLRWMSYEATAAGLRLHPFEADVTHEDAPEDIHESLTGIWWLLELLPLKRSSYTPKRETNSDPTLAKSKERTTRWPHFGSARKIQKGQMIHTSVSTALTAAGYTPRAYWLDNETHTKSFWEDLCSDGRKEFEIDLYNDALDAVKNLSESTTENVGQHFKFLHHFGRSADGRRALIEARAPSALLAALRKFDEAGTLTIDISRDIIQDTLDLATSVTGALGARDTLRSLASKLLIGRSDDMELARRFLFQFSASDLQIIPMGSAVISVALSPDSRYIVCALSNWSIRTWDLVTGMAVSEPLRGHSGSIFSVAFLPDGKSIVSGSEDGTLRIWDTPTGKAVGEPWRGQSGSITSVAVSPDGKFIVSAAWDDTILWDATTGKVVGEPWRGHNDWVSSVAFSPDGKFVVSGTNLGMTLQIWDVRTGKEVGEPLRGHSGSVTSVAFSPDGKTVASGSADETIWIWDVVTGKAVGEPLEGHSGAVNTVVFSPDGKFIVSGSADATIRIWDPTTGKSVGEPLRGHGGEVTSVVLSPDGKTIVSGSEDQTIRVMDTLGTSVGRA